MTLEEAKKEILGMSMGAIGERGMNPLKEGISYDGLIRTYDDILAILAKVDTEPATKDKMTLTELAHELRKIFKFKYLTVEIAIFNPYFCLWTERPYWNGTYWGAKEDGQKHIVTDFLSFETVASIDLSEYKDENGEIDYSKCIVEVE